MSNLKISKKKNAQSFNGFIVEFCQIFKEEYQYSAKLFCKVKSKGTLLNSRIRDHHCPDAKLRKDPPPKKSYSHADQ